MLFSLKQSLTSLGDKPLTNLYISVVCNLSNLFIICNLHCNLIITCNLYYENR